MLLQEQDATKKEQIYKNIIQLDIGKKKVSSK